MVRAGRPGDPLEAFTMTGARLFYPQPTYANPTGVLLADDRRTAVLSVMAKHGAFLVEDDYARELALGPAAPRPLLHDDDDGHVVYLSSLTKLVAPSLRIGALVARGPALARLRALRHLRRLRRTLTLRRDALVAAIRADVPQLSIERVPMGGLHLWLRLPDGVDDTDVASACARRGLLVSPGTPYHAGEPPAPYLRLTYGGAETADLQRGATVLAAVLAGG